MNTVVYDHQIFSLQKFGGVSRYFCEIAWRIQQQHGWHSRVVAPVHFNRYLADSGISTLGLYAPLPLPRLGKLYDRFNGFLTPFLLPRSGADVIHQTYYSARPSAMRAPLVVTVFDMIHELFPRYFPAGDPVAQWKRRAVDAADHVVCISHQTAADLVRILGVPRAKIAVTHLGFSQVFDEAHFSADIAVRRSERPYFLYVGQRAGYKNFSRVLEAFGASARISNDFDLIAFGGVPFTSAELARIKELRLRPNAVRQQFGDDVALASYYAGARALVYPSEYEGFGIPPLEAMGCACAVVCSNASSIPEVVGTAGEYFDPTQIDSIRDALEAVAFDDIHRGKLIAAGREQRRLFSWDKCAEETLGAYQKVLGQRRR